MWDAQAADLLPHFRVLRYDTRGHGASSAPAGDYSIAELGRDVLAIADACGVQRFAFCGLSLGGMIGQWLAAHAPERVTHLVLANTTSRLTDPQPMEARRRAVLEGGMAAVEDLVMGRFFSPAVLASASAAGGDGAADAAVDQSRRLRRLLRGHPGHGSDRRSSRRIQVPTLVISGDLDVGMPWDGHAAVLDALDRGCARGAAPGGPHLEPRASAVVHARRSSIFCVPAAAEIPRRRLRGSARGSRRRLRRSRDRRHDRLHPRVSGARSRATRGGRSGRGPGSITARAGCWCSPPRPRSAAWRNSACTSARVSPTSSNPAISQEVLLQVAVYAGVPAANAAFHVAAEILARETRLTFQTRSARLRVALGIRLPMHFEDA